MFLKNLIPLAPATPHDVNPASDHLYAPHSARAGEMHDAAVIDIIEHPFQLSHRQQGRGFSDCLFHSSLF